MKDTEYFFYFFCRDNLSWIVFTFYGVTKLSFIRSLIL